MSNQLTIDELRAYQAGLLNGPDRHRVEQLLQEDPFYADALEGLEALQQSGKSLTKQTTELRNALHERIHESATERRLMPLWMASAAASVILVICVAIYLIYFTKPAFQPVSATKPMVFEVELTPAKPTTRTTPAPEKKTVAVTTKTRQSQPKAETVQTTVSMSNTQPTAIQPDQPATTPVAATTPFVTGFIRDTHDQPLPGVAITVKGGDRGVVTNANGQFHFDSLQGNPQLTATSVGFLSKTFLASDLAKGPVQLSEDTQALNEVTTIGYASPKKRSDQALPATNSPVAALLSFDEFVARNRQIPVSANNQQNQVIVRFKVQDTGEIRRVQLKKALADTLNTEAIRLIRTYPHWPKGWQEASIAF